MGKDGEGVIKVYLAQNKKRFGRAGGSTHRQVNNNFLNRFFVKEFTIVV